MPTETNAPKPCPICKGKIEIIKDEKGTPMQSTLSVSPANKPPNAAMILGAPAVPVILKICVDCGHIAMFHLNSLGK